VRRSGWPGIVLLAIVAVRIWMDVR